MDSGLNHTESPRLRLRKWEPNRGVTIVTVALTWSKQREDCRPLMLLAIVSLENDFVLLWKGLWVAPEIQEKLANNGSFVRQQYASGQSATQVVVRQLEPTVSDRTIQPFVVETIDLQGCIVQGNPVYRVSGYPVEIARTFFLRDQIEEKIFANA